MSSDESSTGGVKVVEVRRAQSAGKRRQGVPEPLSATKKSTGVLWCKRILTFFLSVTWQHHGLVAIIGGRHNSSPRLVGQVGMKCYNSEFKSIGRLSLHTYGCSDSEELAVFWVVSIQRVGLHGCGSVLVIVIPAQRDRHRRCCGFLESLQALSKLQTDQRPL